jgi:formylglycine-generating enzyme required for sulfatase activity
MLSSPKPFRSIAVLLAGLLAGQPFAHSQPAVPVTAPTDSGAMDSGDPEAFARAKESVRQDPQNYRGHVYVALAHLGLEQLEPAADAAGRALALAPAAAQPQVMKLVETIRVRRGLAAGEQAAAAALAEGQAAKAAKLYESAWRSAPQSAAPGFAAAELYALRLDQPVDAGRLLREMRASVGAETGARVDLKLKALAPVLRQQARDFLAKARATGDGAERARWLTLAEEADPDYAEVYKLGAVFAAQGDAVEKLQAAVERLGRRNRATAPVLAGLPNIKRWLAVPAFRSQVTDLIGAAQLTKIEAGEVAEEALAADDVQEVADLAMRLMPIPTGSFSMGSVLGDASERPVHLVTIATPFWLGEFEVTQAQWRRVMGTGPSKFSGPSLPVEQVSWEDAQEFCRKLTERERAAGRLPKGYVYRLPTEAEWEYACRAGAGDAELALGSVSDGGWHRENSGGGTHAVGQKKANAWGLCDMRGNVWEWCADWMGDYPESSETDPTGAPSGTRRVLRGGGWLDLPGQCSPAARIGYAPSIRDADLGFRIALSPAR